jgi:multimeric flavodoxin WrbA
MKVLALSASPHPNGNSSFLVDRLLEGAREAGAETERVDLNLLSFRGCQGDYACKATGRCGLQDDMQGIYDKLDQADAVVFASPVYMWGINAQLKTLMDRLYAYLKPDHTSAVKPGMRSALVVAQNQPSVEKFQASLENTATCLAFLGFGQTEVLVGAGLGPLDAASRRPDLIAKAKDLGRRLAAREN